MAFNLGKALAHVVRHLGLHGGDGLLIIGPAGRTPAMGMGDVHSRGEEAVDLLHPGQQEGVVQRRQPGIGKTLRHIEQQGRRLGEYAALGDESRHSAFGIDGEVGGGALLAGRQIQLLDPVRAPASVRAIRTAMAQVPGAR